MTMEGQAPPMLPRPDEADLVRLAADLRLVIGRMARRLRQRGEPGVSASLLSALWTIERLQPVTLGELAVAERVQPPTVTRIVARLEELALVSRHADASDRRIARVRLTPAGRRLLDRTRNLRTAYLARRLRSLGPRERSALQRAVVILSDLLEEADAG
jgi:DNA-binding MarR family transcriptional regulator